MNPSKIIPYYSENTQLRRKKRNHHSAKSFVRLSDGITHYERLGAGEDPLVVLVHGISTPMFVWDYQLEALVRSGYQVLRYDLFGRGLSDRPSMRYDAQLYYRQLIELLAELDCPEPYAMVGLSLGGPIVANFAAKHPDRLERLFFVAPAGLRERMPWWYYLTVFTPGLLNAVAYTLGDWYWERIGPGNLTNDPDKQKEARRKLLVQLEFEGFHRAIISTLRHGPVYGSREDYEKIGNSDLPVRVCWSRKDRVVPYRLHTVLEEAVPQVDVISARDGTHAVNYDRPEVVNPPLLDFL